MSAPTAAHRGDAADPAHRANALARESSPYLLQHAYNPVDWRGWNDESIALARQQGRPIFLSVGYSTCYWCHVMERESFENDATAGLMNRAFVNVKVDREERPDVDQLYMTAVQMLTGQGGWPMSVWLTPDLKPFYAGTYFPPRDGHGRPGFPRLVEALEDAWAHRRKEVDEQADEIVEMLRRNAEPPRLAKPLTLDWAWVDRLIDRSISDFDAQHGGYGGAPKFPRQTQLELLLQYLQMRPADVDPDGSITARLGTVREQVRATLDAMANGGIRDHLGGGFHRYSTDAGWLVPHFEIMLYDQAMLAWCYAEAYRQFEDRRYADVCRGICDFVLREMTDASGAFYTAWDAEVDAREGLFYLWTLDEVRQVLGADTDRFAQVYGLDQGPNFEDPHHGNGRPETNILFLPHGPRDEADAAIAAMRQTLYHHRAKRKKPLLDTKVITSWNGLMIRGLAHAGGVLGEERYLHAAQRAANFCLVRHRTPDGGLYRTSRDGRPRHHAFLDDYAALMQGCLELFMTTGHQGWRDHAAALAIELLRRFGSEADGGASRGFFFTSNDAVDLPVRQKVATDSPLPSGNAMAANALQQLDHPRHTLATIDAFASHMQRFGEGMSAMVETAMRYVNRFGTVELPLASTAPSTESSPVRQVAEQALDLVQLTPTWDDDTTLRLTVRVQDGWHVQSHEAAEGLIPTRLSVLAPAAELVDAIMFPPARHADLGGQGFGVPILDGTFDVVVRFTSPPARPLRLMFHYQPCGQHSCLPPVTREVDVNV
jgi:uncharacterized protein YyaL (SSP411 family)